MTLRRNAASCLGVSSTAATSRVIALPSGAALGVEEYGARDGEPVFFFHGWPSGASQGRLLDAAARSLGIRIIAPDRPGCGRSSPQRGRRLVDWPAVVRELAAALGVERFRVLGVSGGGPYALACAWGLADAVESAAVVCGAPPLAELGSAAGFNFVYRTMLAAYRHTPWLVRGLFRGARPIARVAPPGWMMVAMRGVLVAPDKATLADPAISQMCHDGFRSAWGEYRDGVFEDAELYTQAWGFPLEEISVPVRVWHGTEDANFSHRLAAYAKRIPTGTMRIVEGEGHYSLPIRRAGEILADLLATRAAAKAAV